VEIQSKAIEKGKVTIRKQMKKGNKIKRNSKNGEMKRKQKWKIKGMEWEKERKSQEKGKWNRCRKKMI